MTEPLTAEYLEDCRRRANRYMGQWTGSAGALAADVRRLMAEVERLKVQLAYREELRRPLPALGYFAD